MNTIEILDISVNVCVRSCGHARFAVIAISTEYCFTEQDEAEFVELTWHYFVRMGR